MTRARAAYAVREVAGLVVMAVALFAAAGTVAWWPAWALLAIMAAWTAATAYLVTRVHPALLAERLAAAPGTPVWDAAIVGAVALGQLARYVVAGLDHRAAAGAGSAAPAGGIGPGAQAAAVAVCALGYVLFVWANAVNAFFSRLVRIQTERGHRVVTTGPYRLVRHPAYLGAIAYELAAPIALASWRALAISAVTAALLVLRTALEDRLLTERLAGYADYARRVRARLVPGVW